MRYPPVHPREGLGALTAVSGRARDPQPAREDHVRQGRSGEFGAGVLPPSQLHWPPPKPGRRWPSARVLACKAVEVVNCVPLSARFYLPGTWLGAVLFFSLTQFHNMQLKGCCFAKGASVLAEKDASPLQSHTGLTPRAPTSGETLRLKRSNV